jgi:hypothetical protein
MRVVLRDGTIKDTESPLVECRRGRVIGYTYCAEERLEMVVTEDGVVVPTMMPFRAIEAAILEVPIRLK